MMIDFNYHGMLEMSFLLKSDTIWYYKSVHHGNGCRCL